MKYIIRLGFIFFLFSQLFSKPLYDKHYFITGENRAHAEYLAALDLQKDLQEVPQKESIVLADSDKIDFDGYFYFVGTIKTNRHIAEIANKGSVDLSENNPGKRGGIIQVVTLDDGNNLLVLGGSDTEGTTYAVFDFIEKYLGVDPFSFWTDYRPAIITDFNPNSIESIVINPPYVDYLAYLVNDEEAVI